MLYNEIGCLENPAWLRPGSSNWLFGGGFVSVRRRSLKLLRVCAALFAGAGVQVLDGDLMESFVLEEGPWNLVKPCSV